MRRSPSTLRGSMPAVKLSGSLACSGPPTLRPTTSHCIVSCCRRHWWAQQRIIEARREQQSARQVHRHESNPGAVPDPAEIPTEPERRTGAQYLTIEAAVLALTGLQINRAQVGETRDAYAHGGSRRRSPEAPRASHCSTNRPIGSRSPSPDHTWTARAVRSAARAAHNPVALEAADLGGRHAQQVRQDGFCVLAELRGAANRDARDG
jgi:hypothetical protein